MFTLYFVDLSVYYRITAYCSAEDCTFIADSNGKFEKLWQFSAYLVSKGVKVLEVSTDEKFLDGNIPRAQAHTEYVFIQAARKGQPNISTVTMDGRSYRMVEVAGRKYIPDRNEVG